jgi:hypothetical protein
MRKFFLGVAVAIVEVAVAVDDARSILGRGFGIFRDGEEGLEG